MFLIFLASGQDFLLVSGREVDFRFSLFPSWTSEWIYHGAAFGGLAALTYAALRVSLPWNWQVVALLSLTIAVVYSASQTSGTKATWPTDEPIYEMSEGTPSARLLLFCSRALLLMAQSNCSAGSGGRFGG